MSNNREKDLWETLDKYHFWMALLIIVILVVFYFGIGWMAPYHMARQFLQDIIANLIPVILVFIILYAFFRHIQTLRSERETGELASKIADMVKSELSALKASHPVDMPEGQLIIKSAKYGATVKNIDYYNDVTNVVRSAIVAGRVEIRVDNDNFRPDPIKGEPKHVTVDYVYAGKDGYSKTVPENATLFLP